MRTPAPAFIARYEGPFGQAEADALLARVTAGWPSLQRPPTPGTRRGIDAYRPDSLRRVFRIALNMTAGFLGAPPELMPPRRFNDHLFAQKFFYEIPLRPNPADKLEARRFLPRALGERVGIPRRWGISRADTLPPDAAAPPGRYWLKATHGNGMQRQLDWPPSAGDRAELAELLRLWAADRYGLIWGEWWYAKIPPRIYLEEDLGPLMAGRDECRVIAAAGEPLFWTLSGTLPDGRRHLTFHDDDWRPTGFRNSKFAARPQSEPPEAIEVMREAAREIGSRIGFVRVDFMNAAGPRPYLGEITLCPGNAMVRFEPPEAEDALAARIGGAVHRGRRPPPGL